MGRGVKGGGCEVGGGGAHVQELLDLGVDQTRIHFIDGEYCSWHGVRMIQSIQYLRNWKDQHLS